MICSIPYFEHQGAFQKKFISMWRYRKAIQKAFHGILLKYFQKGRLVSFDLLSKRFRIDAGRLITLGRFIDDSLYIGFNNFFYTANFCMFHHNIKFWVPLHPIFFESLDSHVDTNLITISKTIYNGLLFRIASQENSF